MARFCDEDLDSKFKLACKYVQSVAGSLDKSKLLQFYGYYKQATIGRCNIPKPSWYELEAKQKWNAWNEMGQMGKQEAMIKYISLLFEIKSDWEEENIVNRGWVAVSSMKNSEPVIDDNEKTLFDLVKEGETEKLKILLDASNVNDKDEDGLGMIHWAADRGNVEMLKCLATLGADLNLIDSTGQTPLHYSSACGHVDAVIFLLDNGANPTIKCEEGLTPADVALEDEIGSIVNAFKQVNIEQKI